MVYLCHCVISISPLASQGLSFRLRKTGREHRPCPVYLTLVGESVRRTNQISQFSLWPPEFFEGNTFLAAFLLQASGHSWLLPLFHRKAGARA